MFCEQRYSTNQQLTADSLDLHQYTFLLAFEGSSEKYINYI